MIADKLYKELVTEHYDYPISAQQLPFNIDSHKTAKRRANRSKRLGYELAEIKREDLLNDIFVINVSKEKRQGRDMHPAYFQYPSHSPLPPIECSRHGIYTYGIIKDKLRAYAVIYRCGDLVMINTILGHGDYLKDDIMYLLVTEILKLQDSGVAFYNRHDSGTDGLRYFKEKLGFKPVRIQWQM